MSEEPKKRRGRPPVPGHPVYIQIKIPLEEKRTIQAAALQIGMKLSEWMRAALMKVAREALEQDMSEVPVVQPKVRDEDFADISMDDLAQGTGEIACPPMTPPVVSNRPAPPPPGACPLCGSPYCPGCKPITKKVGK